MNYASMIEERRLKQGFIIATLISTIVGTFTTGIGLFDRLSDKRRQHKRDHSQDNKIQELERRVQEAEQRPDQRARPQGGRGQRGDGYDEDDEAGLRDSLEFGGPLVRREYERGYAALGRRFAEGDLLAQTQLQSQIITLQSTVIRLLQDALTTGLPPDLTTLRNASEFAREGAVRALRDEYQRMLTAAGPPGARQRPRGPVRRTSSTPDLRMRGRGDSSVCGGGGGGEWAVGRALTFNRPGPLFCAYAEELQRTSRPVDGRVMARRDGCGSCPGCGAVVEVEREDGRGWVAAKEVVTERMTRDDGPGAAVEVVEYVEDRAYALGPRFLLKCHREGTGYACWLCFRFREGDTLCRGVESLVKHVGEKHTVAELEREPDVRDVTGPYR